jgi:multicomponent Na+:H+ antiporter subunit D
MRTGIYPPELPSVNLDFDWFYRRLGPGIANSAINFLADLRITVSAKAIGALTRISRRIYRHHGPQGVLARTWPTGSMVIWVAILLASYLVLYYI